MENWENKTVSVGIDLHKTQFTVCAIDSNRDVLFEAMYLTEKSGYDEFIKTCHTYEDEGCTVSMAIEATGNARYFRNLMLAEGFNVIVINTLKFKVITQSANKTDKRDAKTIAIYLLADFLPESYLCDQETEELRRLIKLRKEFVGSTVSIKNMIHNMMLNYGIVTTAACFQSQKKRLAFLSGLEDHSLATKNTVSTFQLMLESLDVIYEQVKKIEEQISEIVLEDETVELLKTVPGIGQITAVTLRAFIGTIDRFDSYKQFAAYCGLTPFVKFSNEKGFTGHITKSGPVELRTAMVQCVMGMIRLNKKLGYLSLVQDYYRMKRNKGSGKSIIAFARKLSRVIYVMLKTKSPFDPNKLSKDDEVIRLQEEAANAS